MTRRPGADAARTLEATADASAPRIGALLGQYLVQAPVATGDGCEAFEARDTELDRVVLIRRLAGGSARVPQVRAGLMADARAVTALTHPNIARLYDVAEDASGIYAIFDQVGGEPLSAVLSRRALSLRRAVGIASDVCDAVAEIHGADLVHGELTPDAIVITPRGAASLRFGLLPAVATCPPLPGSRAWAEYAAPEVLKGGARDWRSDLFSIGALLFRMLAGHPPPRPLRPALARPASARSFADLGEDVQAIAVRALADHPDARGSAAGIHAELRAVDAVLAVRDEERQGRQPRPSLGRRLIGR